MITDIAPWLDEFENLWNDYGMYEFFELAKRIKPEITDKELWRGWQWTNVLHPNFSVAIQEFVMLLNGTY